MDSQSCSGLRAYLYLFQGRGMCSYECMPPASMEVSHEFEVVRCADSAP
jgi:hypothetical protein